MENIGNEFDLFTTHLDKKHSEMKFPIESQVMTSPEPKDITECRTPIDRLEVERLPERRSTPLDKCNQIV